MLYEKCKLDSAAFTETPLKNVEFRECSLRRAEFQRSPLADVDLTSDDIEGVRVELSLLRGAIVTPVQALMLASLLGLIVK